MSEIKVNTISPYNTTAINVNTPGGFIVSGDVSTSNNVVIGNYTMANPPVGAAASKYYVDQQFALRNLGATAVGATQLYVDTSISTNNSVLDSRYLRTTSATGQTVSGAGITFSGGPYSFGSGGVLLNMDTVNNRVGVGTTAASGTKLHVHGGSIAVSNAAQAQTAYSTVAQDSSNNLTINGYNSTVMQVAGSSKLTIAATLITAATNTTISGGLTATGIVDITNTTDATSTSTGAVQVDGGVGVVKSLWVGGTINGNGTIPLGGIIMWYGTIANIPAGWALCNGQTVNSLTTPDLRDKFVIGAASDSSGAKTNVTGSLTQTGGSKDAVVVSHTHTATSSVTDPGHKHGLYGSNSSVANDGGLPDGAFIRGDGLLTAASPVTANSKDTATTTTGVTVSTTVTSTGSSGTDANLPPYYALAFIMRVA